MLTIYGIYRSRASRTIWLAKEIGLPFRLVQVVMHYRLPDHTAPDAPLNTRSAEFLEINPNGRILAVDDGGLVLCESLAINLYLARRYGGTLGPIDPAEDGQIAMWSLWAANEAEPHTVEVLYHRVNNPHGECDPVRAQLAIEALRKPFAVLDAALARGSYLVGERFTVADINVAGVLGFALAAPELFAAAPRVKAWIEACRARPCFREMVAERDREPQFRARKPPAHSSASPIPHT
jgi:glutathione S-transferase